MAGSELSGHLFDIAPYTTSWHLLFERFVVPPFSTLDTRSGTWRTRRAKWNELPLGGYEGRTDNLTWKPPETATDEVSMKMKSVGTTSVFDPVLCELAYRWWCPVDGTVLDPFAGGAVRGVVAGILGREYHGVDLSATQLAANARVRAAVARYLTVEPEWYEGDSTVTRVAAGEWADLVFTCPPYGNLEKYSDNPADLSTMSYDAFVGPYGAALDLAFGQLKPDRFAVLVVGNYREPGGDGYLNDMVAATTAAAYRAGLRLYADCILLNSTASAGVRASFHFNSGRKPTMVHQHVLVFVKGDWRRAAAAAERLDPAEIPQEGDEGHDVVSEDGARLGL